MPTWLLFSLLTVLSWGVYGVLLHMGRGFMPGGTVPNAETANAGLKAFLWVGVAYFVVAVVGPMIVLWQRKTDWSFTGSGISWSFIAGTAGAIGAFTLVLALGAAAAPIKIGGGGFGPLAASAVMPIVFAGAPVVNTIVAMLLHPPEGGFKSLPVPFIVGILLAASGAFLVAKFAPTNKPAKPAKPAAGQVAPAGH